MEQLGVVVHNYLPSALWVFHARWMKEGGREEVETETEVHGEEFDFEVWMLRGLKIPC